MRVRDVLPRHVLDIAFERIEIGDAGVAHGIEFQRQRARLRERRLRTLDVATLERSSSDQPTNNQRSSVNLFVMDSGAP